MLAADPLSEAADPKPDLIEMLESTAIISARISRTGCRKVLAIDHQESYY